MAEQAVTEEQPLSVTPQVLVEVQLVSFGYKNGPPGDVDYYFDLLSVPNPWRLRGLAHLEKTNGLDQLLQEHLFADPCAQQRWRGICREVQQWVAEVARRAWLPCPACGVRTHSLPLAGNSATTPVIAATQVGIGCKSGHHRSVAFTERLVAMGLPPITMQSTEGPILVGIRFKQPMHRDLYRPREDSWHSFSRTCETCQEPELREPAENTTGQTHVQSCGGQGSAAHLEIRASASVLAPLSKTAPKQEKAAVAGYVRAQAALKAVEDLEIGKLLSAATVWNQHAVSPEHAARTRMPCPACQGISTQVESRELASANRQREDRQRLRSCSASEVAQSDHRPEDLIGAFLTALIYGSIDKSPDEVCLESVDNGLDGVIKPYKCLTGSKRRPLSFGVTSDAEAVGKLENGRAGTQGRTLAGCGEGEVRVELVTYSSTSPEGPPVDCDFYVDIPDIQAPPRQVLWNGRVGVTSRGSKETLAGWVMTQYPAPLLWRFTCSNIQGWVRLRSGIAPENRDVSRRSEPGSTNTTNQALAYSISTRIGLSCRSGGGASVVFAEYLRELPQCWVPEELEGRPKVNVIVSVRHRDIALRAEQALFRKRLPITLTCSWCSKTMSGIVPWNDHVHSRKHWSKAFSEFEKSRSGPLVSPDPKVEAVPLGHQQSVEKSVRWGGGRVDSAESDLQTQSCSGPMVHKHREATQLGSGSTSQAGKRAGNRVPSQVEEAAEQEQNPLAVVDEDGVIVVSVGDMGAAGFMQARSWLAPSPVNAPAGDPSSGTQDALRMEAGNRMELEGNEKGSPCQSTGAGNAGVTGELDSAGTEGQVACGGPSDVAAGGPSDVAAGGPSDVAAGGPSDVAAGGPSDVAAGGPSDVAAGGPSDVLLARLERRKAKKRRKKQVKASEQQGITAEAAGEGQGAAVVQNGSGIPTVKAASADKRPVPQSLETALHREYLMRGHLHRPGCQGGCMGWLEPGSGQAAGSSGHDLQDADFEDLPVGTGANKRPRGEPHCVTCAAPEQVLRVPLHTSIQEAKDPIL